MGAMGAIKAGNLWYSSILCSEGQNAWLASEANQQIAAAAAHLSPSSCQVSLSLSLSLQYEKLDVGYYNY